MPGRNLSQRLASWMSAPDLVARTESLSAGSSRVVRASLLVVRLVNFDEVASSSHLDRLPDLLGIYLRGLEQAAGTHHGSIDTLLGARALLTFGTWAYVESAPRDALQAALRLLGSGGDSLRASLSSFHPRLDLALGIASGETFVGSIEGDNRAFSGCFGGPGERALALCDLAKAGEVVVDAATLAGAGIDLPEPFGRNAERSPLYHLSQTELHTAVAGRK